MVTGTDREEGRNGTASPSSTVTRSIAELVDLSDPGAFVSS